MTDFAIPALFAILVWWLSTGAVLWLVGAPRRTHAWAMIAISALAGAACVGLVAIAGYTSVGAAYAGFALGIVLWAWHETAFLLGYVTGPRRTPCPPHLKGWKRFVAATETVITHELAIAATAILLTVALWRAPNQIGALTFLLLWGMRLSAKANVFIAAPNLNDQFLPAHLAHLKSYFGTRRAGWFFVASVAGASLVAGLLVYAAATADAGFDRIGLTLVAALAVLAVLEHLFLVLPVPDAALWAWAQRSSAASIAVSEPHRASAESRPRYSAGEGRPRYIVGAVRRNESKD